MTDTRQKRLRLMLVVGFAIALSGGVASSLATRGADERMKDLREEVEAAVDGVDFDDVMAARSVTADGIRIDDLLGVEQPTAVARVDPDRVAVRWSVDYWGVERCVLVVWTAGGRSLDHGKDACDVGRPSDS